MCGWDFVCVYQYTREFVRSIWKWQRRGKAKWILKDTSVFLNLSQCLLYICLFLDDKMITLCTCWLQSSCCRLTPDPTACKLCFKLQPLFPIRSCIMINFVAQKYSFMLRSVINKHPYLNDLLCFARLLLQSGRSWKDVRSSSTNWGNINYC